MSDYAQGARGIAPEAATRNDPLALTSTDWLRHNLIVTGSADAVTSFRTAASGASAIPWVSPDLDLLEEDRVMALVHPPDGSAGLSLAGARALAGQIRSAIEVNQQRAAAAIGRVRSCPFDLHALLPVPDRILHLGPDDPASIAWLRTHWGVVQALRHVRLKTGGDDRRLRRSARVEFEFWSPDWTPWSAIQAVRRRWPALVFDIRPDYGGE
ncbi:hypothetical protein [Acidisphaera sp. L21]|uniref:hypothetical protein n=1 Tax=Acidisphaera sp. L21 TaxID=1641851 RepID=UPI00131BFA8F|nr:hypothetical protein [Acidisphaera sp. L21]